MGNNPSATKPCVMRIVRNDVCGKPVVGPKSVIVTKGFINIAAAKDYEEGEEFTQKNGCGELCISEKDCDTLKRINLTAGFCVINHEGIEIMTSSRLLTDASGVAIGYTSGDAQCDAGWSLEIWQKQAGNNCVTSRTASVTTTTGSASIDGTFTAADVGDPITGTGIPVGTTILSQTGVAAVMSAVATATGTITATIGETAQEWLYWAWPFLTNGKVGDVTLENGPYTFEVTAFTKPISQDDQWGTGNVGPIPVLPATAALLNGEHSAEAVRTTVQPPAVTEGAVALAPAA